MCSFELFVGMHANVLTLVACVCAAVVSHTVSGMCISNSQYTFANDNMAEALLRTTTTRYIR